MTEPTVALNEGSSRFEISVPAEGGGDPGVGGRTLAGFTVYEVMSPACWAFVHTEIDPAFGGRGLGSLLIRSALDTARGRGVTVLPFCPFVARFIAGHPDYLDLVPHDQRARFELGDPAGL